MISLEDIEIYLPKYLSTDSQKRLFHELKQFPDNIDFRLYTEYLADSDILYQGDGVKDVLFVEIPSKRFKNVNAMVISNTCDVNPGNERFFA